MAVTYEEIFVGTYDIFGVDGKRTWDIYALTDSRQKVRSITLKYGLCAEIDIDNPTLEDYHRLVIRSMAESRAVALIQSIIPKQRSDPIETARSTWGIPDDHPVII